MIVNTANPNPICASGTDLAIYEAAGKEQLLAERAGIGKIARGDIAVTGTYVTSVLIVSAFVFALKVSPEQRPYEDAFQLYSYCNSEREVPE